MDKFEKSFLNIVTMMFFINFLVTSAPKCNPAISFADPIKMFGSYVNRLC